MFQNLVKMFQGREKLKIRIKMNHILSEEIQVAKEYLVLEDVLFQEERRFLSVDVEVQCDERFGSRINGHSYSNTEGHSTTKVEGSFNSKEKEDDVDVDGENEDEENGDVDDNEDEDEEGDKDENDNEDESIDENVQEPSKTTVLEVPTSAKTSDVVNAAGNIQMDSESMSSSHIDKIIYVVLNRKHMASNQKKKEVVNCG